MDFFEVVNERHSMRAFADRPVETEKVQKILETANRAPSAGDLQGYEIYLVTRPEHRSALVQAALAQEFIAEAPVVLIFCTNPARSAVRYKQRGIQLYSVQDATIACTFAMLAATALGLSTVWVRAFEEDAVREAVGIPQDLTPVAMLPIGYAGKKPRITPRRELSDLVHEVG
jgi:nitroreductase